MRWRCIARGCIPTLRIAEQRTDTAPSPPAGEGWGAKRHCCFAAESAPHPNLPPQAGEGAVSGFGRVFNLRRCVARGCIPTLRIAEQRTDAAPSPASGGRGGFRVWESLQLAVAVRSSRMHSNVRIAEQRTDTAPSPARGGGLGWGRNVTTASPLKATPIPTFPRKREKERFPGSGESSTCGGGASCADTIQRLWTARGARIPLQARI